MFIPLQIYLVLKLNSHLFFIFVELIQSSLSEVDTPRAIPALKEYNIYNNCRPITWVFN